MIRGLQSLLGKGWRVIYSGILELYCVSNIFSGQGTNCSRQSQKSTPALRFHLPQNHAVKFLSKMSHTLQALCGIRNQWHLPDQTRADVSHRSPANLLLSLNST